MLFNSFTYLIFLPLVVAFYHTIPQRFRWQFLLLASVTFYVWWKPAYIVLLGLSILIDWWSALKIEATSEPRVRKRWLVLSVVSNLGLLVAFKYLDFFTVNLNILLNWAGSSHQFPQFQWVLPVGISFYTFQSMSYTVDVYRRHIKAEKNICFFALFVSFFPQLVAGPIERAGALIDQLRGNRQISWDRFFFGLKILAWGLFKKMVIADRLAAYVDLIYADPVSFSGSTLYLATVFFAFQIYCDFSGYSDIAVGSAQMLGIDLMENFRSPYLATSIIDFWKRWHISLTTWFRDYLYIPLGGNRNGGIRSLINIFIVFLVSGLWHGASWTFIGWGAYHGLLYLGNRLWLQRESTSAAPLVIWRGIQRLTTFHLVLIGWVFFRAKTITDAKFIFLHLWDSRPLQISLGSAFTQSDLWVSLMGILLLLITEYVKEKKALLLLYAQAPTALRWSFYYALFFLVVLLSHTESQQFIYFQF
ncbi:MAG: hypothetical protein KCHDKBKB_00928 [Elusimicrobia bacterium]|nr:hypothetical protein [Elusimicrobiota bacterium]